MTGAEDPTRTAAVDRPHADEQHPPKPVVRAGPLWFAVCGGVIAWALQLGVAWSVMEVSCLTPIDDSVLQQGTDSLSARLAAWCATGLAFLIAVAALATALVLFRRLKHLKPDVLAAERTHLLLVIALFLDALAVAAICGGGISLGVLPSCA